MSFFRILIFLVFLTLSGFSYSDNHETQKEEVLNKVEEIAKEIEDEDEVPLNDPFAGNEGNNSMSGNIPEEELDN